MTKIVMSRTSVREAALFLLVIACLLSPLGFMLRSLQAQVAEKNAPLTAPDVESDGVAAIAAEFRVDESGAATYSIPLYTVPGTAGVAPRLSLNYSSQGGYGPLGKGWSIGGLSLIARCRATREAGDFISGGTPTDGNPKPINFSADDRFCLDGQRLVTRIGGAACAAVSGMTVQTLGTEIESFQRVCAYTPTASAANGPAFFTVERKDGSISWYGDRDNNTTANRADGYVETNAAGHTAKAIVWAQTRFQDSTGNYIDYRYHENPGTPAASVEHLLAEVQFTGKTVLAGQSGSASLPYAKVMFNYAMRPEAQWGLGYASGGTFVQRHWLANVMSCITAASGQCTPADQARFYEFGYGTSASGSGLELLGSVLECRDSSKAVCAAPTAFTWSAGKYEFATIERPTAPTLANDHIRDFKTGDINGDGRPDAAFQYLAGSGCVGGTWIVTTISTLNTAGTPTFANAQFNCVPANIVDRGSGAWHLFDYDGDGRDDLFVSSAIGQGWRVHPSTGSGFNMGVNLISGLTPAIPSVQHKDSQAQLADLNGDGLIDIVYPSGGGMRARVMQRQSGGFGWGPERAMYVDTDTLYPMPPECDDPYNQYIRNCSRWISGMPATQAGYVQLADFNGDASSDVLINVSTHMEHYVGGPGCEVIVPAASPTGYDEERRTSELRRYEGRTSREFASSPSSASTCWQSQHTDYMHAMVVDDQSADSLRLVNYAVLSGVLPLSVVLGDVNGDGLTDAFVRRHTNSDWYSAINTGRTLTATGGTTFPLSNFRDQVRFVDANGDGRTDMLYLVDTAGNKTYYVRYAQASGGYAAGVPLPGGNARLCEGNGCDAGQRAPLFADVDGDGLLDFVSFNFSGANLGLYVSRSNGRFSPRDTIVRFKNGFDAVTDIYYAPLTNNALYRRDSGTRNSVTWGRGAPVTDLLMPMYAVAAASSSSPQDGNPGAMATVYFRYAGAKMQAGGRGFLGFREIVTYDPNQVASQHVVTSTQYVQEFPYTGMPQETTKRVVTSAYVVPACLAAAPTESCFSTPGQVFPALAGTVFAKSTQVWEADRDIGVNHAEYAVGVQTPVHVRTSGTEEEVRDPFNGGGITSKVATIFEYGAYGNVLQTLVQTYSGSGSLVAEVATGNVYGQDNASKWRLGRLTAATVTHRRPGRDDVVRSASFAYSMSGPVTGLLTEERTQPGGGNDKDLRKLYLADEYGNRVRSVVCAHTANCDPSAQVFRPAGATGVHRYSRTLYDALGRFPVETKEPFWSGSAAIELTTQTVHGRDSFGNVTHASDVNGVQIMAQAGTLGRAYWTWTQSSPGGLVSDTDTGVRSVTTYRWCGTGGSTVSCPAGARFRQQVLATASPSSWTYFDVLGRPIMSASETFNVGTSGKDVSAACTAYDAAGKPRKVSIPFFLAGTVGSNGPTVASNACTAGERRWAVTSYDVLGRPVHVTTPNNNGTTVTTTSAYNGLTTTVTDARGKQTVTTNLPTGEAASVTDHNGTAMTYAYYADGTVQYVDRDAGRGQIRNAFTYDVLGRKILQNDPDSGVTQFQYNAAGELIAQIDSAGNRIDNWYDARGRIWRKRVRRADNLTESESFHDYDTAANGIGQPAGESITGLYGGWIGQSGRELSFSRTYSYDGMGRPLGSSTTIDGTAYPTAAVYDGRGRIWKSQDASGRWVKADFNARGMVRAICNYVSDESPLCSATSTIVRSQETDAWGNVIRERRGNSAEMDVVRDYWAETGRIAWICAGNVTNCNLMDEGYAWDSAGNLSTQVKENRYAETFTYDHLNRLTHAYVTVRNGTTLPTPLLTHWAQYDGLGNICARIVDGAGQGLTYAGRAGCGVSTNNGSGGTGPVGPHQVSKVGVGGNARDYYYDIRGNQILRDAPGTASDRAIQYSLDDKAYEIDLGGAKTRYWYGPDGQRYKREHQGKKTLYLGNVEIEIVGSTTTYKRTVAGAMLQTVVGSTVTSHYLFHDHLGSLVKTTNASGTAIDGLDYQPFGQRRHVADPAVNVEVGSSLTPRGFTGHEHVDAVDMDVIHMNGRIYDPEIGRFLQADPVIQAPGNLQSWNAYTYVFNNPLRYTDPTGMFALLGIRYVHKTISRAFMRAIGPEASGAIASIGCGFAGPYYALCYGAANYEIARAFGASVGDAVKSGVIGAFTSYLGQAAGMGNSVLLQAAAGGVSAELQGGKFGHGFVSAGLTAMVMPQIGAGFDSRGGRIVAGAIAGGTISTMTGGKFANGAMSGALQGAMMSGASRDAPRDAGIAERSDVEAARIAPLATNDANEALGDLIGMVYPTLDDAALAWAERVRPIAARHNAEIASRFFRVKGGYAFGSATSDGYVGTVDPSFGGSVKGAFHTKGYIHTHPSNRSFSSNDLAWAYSMYQEAFGVHQRAYVVLHNGNVHSWTTMSWAVRPRMNSWKDYMRYTREVEPWGAKY